MKTSNRQARRTPAKSDPRLSTPDNSAAIEAIKRQIDGLRNGDHTLETAYDIEALKVAVGLLSELPANAMPKTEAEAKQRQRLSKGRGKKGPQKVADLLGESREQVGALFGTNRQYVSDAKAIMQRDPAAFDLNRAMDDLSYGLVARAVGSHGSPLDLAGQGVVFNVITQGMDGVHGADHGETGVSGQNLGSARKISLQDSL